MQMNRPADPLAPALKKWSHEHFSAPRAWVLDLLRQLPRITTLPVAMYQHVDGNTDPLVASISVLLIVLTLIVVQVVDRSVGLAKAFVK